jgi:hypothetical protein
MLCNVHVPLVLGVTIIVFNVIWSTAIFGASVILLCLYLGCDFAIHIANPLVQRTAGSRLVWIRESAARRR